MINNAMQKQSSQTSNLDKAAILLLSMGEEAAAKIFAKMSREDVQKISSHMAKLPGVTNEGAHAVIQDFFRRFSSHSGISGAPRSYLQRSLDMAIGPRLTKTMINDLYGDELLDDFQKLEWVSPEVLAKSFESQHMHMKATLLSFLPPDTASAVMSHFPEHTHDELLHRVANMKDVSANVIEELKIAVQECIDYVSSQNNANVHGIKQAAEILNRYSGDRAGLLENLKVADEELALSVTENMYDFSTLSRQDDDTLSTIVQEIEQEQLAVALKGADEAIKAAILGAVTKRMGDALIEQMELMGPVPASQIETARKEIMVMIRTMNDEETIKYKIFEEKVVE